MKHTVPVVGKGILADLVGRELSGSGPFEVIRQTGLSADIPGAAKLAVVVYDGGYADDYEDAEEVLGRTGVPWLRGFAVDDEGFAGPLVRPGTAGCSRCADQRRLLIGRRPERRDYAALIEGAASGGGMLAAGPPPLAGLWQTAHILAGEIRNVLLGKRSRLQEHMAIVNLNTLESSLHRFLPDPLCPACGRLPADSQEAAALVLQPRPKAHADSYRSRRLEDMRDLLLSYVDSRLGLINEKVYDTDSVFASVRMSLPSFALGSEISAGRSHSFASSELTAVLEALERNCGQGPRGKRTVVRDSYNHLADQALNPVRVGLFSAEQYALTDFPFEPYEADAPMDWVWGYSFLLERPILVPESLAYYSLNYGGGFVYEGSNGCAIGGSLEEVILHGVLEVVERDSFLLTWYARLPLPRLDPGSGDAELQLMVARLRAVAGYEVSLYNMTMENGIPAIWAVARTIASGEAKLNLLCAAGAHPDPLRAAKSAVHELAGMLFQLQDVFAEAREEAERMVADPSLVTHMMHHVLLYGLPQAEERLQYLLAPDRPLQTFREQFGDGATASRADLTGDLLDLVRRFRRLGLDVIVIDQTSPETERSGLFCVKVLIPGMLPMTFGYQLSRVAGLERVYQVPVRLGYADRPLTKEQLNPHPHPFI
ncbi:TOMM precursor leader peptide-binding protein [Paenibacillus oceani]|uniref:TOMM leader peptide-binding protein n=1 Tax=Paenibacillus oceani TaxID=2772510 RepID=A0A927H3F1_9BACL|nr:TOMM precursor leader peptide-binding protein [Paenibacillus oceani]MBD2866795.1 TOMM precursor leader peptide-binding protein [Paenibacillus oceani]